MEEALTKISNQVDEEWINIKGFEGYYQISNCGQVKSITRTIIYKDKRRWDIKERILIPYFNNKGYWYVNLSKNGKAKPCMIHQLVAKHFLQHKSDKPQVNHKDCNKNNNHADNLEFVNNSENQIHAVRNGFRGTKLSIEDVLYIRKHSCLATENLAKKFNVSKSLINQVKSRKIWNHVTSLR